ncbi:LptF/LptG family permease [Brytella acorum]|uniref:LptF/LptG family permease n=1 Tax=Brytella acorum TaxID=2959299 RepID=A0AA35Y5M7_9PROT|nr:LptF/LptG family permease [Brytella acorum]CAI9122201.1 LptF/LptG family permease [Brytella acorum]
MMRKRLPTLDRYLLTQLIPPFVIALGAVLLALLLERLMVLFNDLAATGSSLATFIGLLTDLLPHYMGLALPAALCVSVFQIARRMSENNEIDALMAAGVSLLRIARPFMQTGLALGAMSVLLYGYIQPVARYDYRAGFYFAAHTGWAPHLQAGMFAATADGAVLTADAVSHRGTVLHRVFIREQEKNGVVRIITAKRGLLTVAPGKRATRLDLWNGMILTDPGPGSLHDPSQTYFAHSDRLILPKAAAAKFRKRGMDQRELTLLELVKYLRHPSSTPPDIGQNDVRAELNFRLARALAIPFIPALAVALAMGAKRRRPVVGLIALALVLVGFDHLLQFGNGLVSQRGISALLAIWMPELIFCAICVSAIHRRSRGSWLRRRLVRPT